MIGAGVSGLQAIATARRLGGVVSAFDVRPASREQVLSLGAKFVAAEVVSESAETAGGYARSQTEDERARTLTAIAGTSRRRSRDHHSAVPATCPVSRGGCRADDPTGSGHLDLAAELRATRAPRADGRARRVV